MNRHLRITVNQRGSQSKSKYRKSNNDKLMRLLLRESNISREITSGCRHYWARIIWNGKLSADSIWGNENYQPYLASVWQLEDEACTFYYLVTEKQFTFRSTIQVLHTIHLYNPYVF